MEIKRSLEVTGVLLSENASGVRTLTISTKAQQIELDFSVGLWEQLADSARWFQSSVNGTSLVTAEQMSEEE